MKSLQLDLEKKLLIVNYQSKAELDKTWEFSSAFGKPTIMFDGIPTKALLKGTFLTEEDYRILIADEDGGISISNHPLAYKISYSRHENAFRDIIEKEGFYWLENPNEKPRVIEYDEFNPLMMDLHDQKVKDFNDAEFRTLRFPIIFEILE